MKHAFTQSSETLEPGRPGGGTGTALIVRPEQKTQKPPMYKVWLLNDDYTPMEFVVRVLEGIFNKGHTEAESIMLDVHRKGMGLAGVFTFEVAETKAAQVAVHARRNLHPLKPHIEKADDGPA